MASEYCWMEPANGCRICMRILSGERARLPGFGLTEGSLVATCGALRLHLDILQLGNGTQNHWGFRRDRHVSQRKWPAAFTLGSGAGAQWLPSSPDLT